MNIRIDVTQQEHAMIKRAAGATGCSVSRWAEINLVDLAQIETSGEGSSRK